VRRRLEEGFDRILGRGGERRVFFAPGRINLIGAHLDYNGGTVMPVGVDLGVFLMARARSDATVRMASLDVSGVVETGLGPQERGNRGDWSSYPRGVLHFFPKDRGRRTGLDLLFCGTVPTGGGLSSSAAIQVVTGLALSSLFRADLSPVELARLAFESETAFVGVRCGIMDQFASALARPGHALRLECSTQTFDHVPLPVDRLEILVLDTRKKRDLVDSQFNARVEQCRSAHRILSERVPGRACLAAFTSEDLRAHGDALPEVERRRARHVIEEMERVRSFARALEKGDLPAAGRAITASHASCRDHYEVSCEELDFMVEEASRARGVYGARLTGAGFGGCAMALAEPGTFERVSGPIADRFEERFGVRPRLSQLRPGVGPLELR
jgi:galactokinase